MPAPLRASVLLLAFGLLGTAAPVRAAVAPALRADTKLSSADLRADAALLRHALETLHPGLRRYLGPAQVDSVFAALDARFATDRTLAETWLALTEATAAVRCGHTWPSFFNQSDAVEAALFRARRLPFEFRWLGGRMIVTRALAGTTGLPRGAEIETIDGVPASRILARLLQLGRADGHNQPKRVATLQLTGDSRYEAFDVLWPLCFPTTDTLATLRVRAPGAKSARTVRVRKLTWAERVALLPTTEADAHGGDAALWRLEWLEPGVGMLRMPSWVLYDSQWKWQEALAAQFAALDSARATDLVIDLRANEGGSDVGDAIVAHLAAAPVPRPVIHRRVRYRRVPDDLRPFLDTWDRTFFDWGAAAMDSSADGFFRLRRDADDDPGGAIAPREPRFAGRVWVLVGATNSSATFEFANLVRQNRLGTLVGQPTGGNQRGINGGCFFFLRLPRTGLEVDLPLIGQFPAGEPPDAGLEPDVLVPVTGADVAGGRDPELAEVRARIRKARGR